MALPLRDAVRAIVTDDARRVLLVRFEFPDRVVWATPGGGIEPGESHADAIARELREEVGVHDLLDIGRPVWTRIHRFTTMPGYSGQRETFYLVPLRAAPGVPVFSEEELRAEHMTGSRWWTLAELNAARDTLFAPSRLPELYGSLVRTGPPAEPIDTGE